MHHVTSWHSLHIPEAGTEGVWADAVSTGREHSWSISSRSHSLMLKKKQRPHGPGFFFLVSIVKTWRISIPSYKTLPTWCGGGQPAPLSAVVCGVRDGAGTGNRAYFLLLCHQTYHQISPPRPRANGTRPSWEIQPPRRGLVPKLITLRRFYGWCWSKFHTELSWFGAGNRSILVIWHP